VGAGGVGRLLGLWLTVSDGGLTKLSGLHLGHPVRVGAEPTTGLTMVPAVKAAHLPERI